MKKLYLVLAIIGLVVPYYFFISFLLANGLNLPLFFEQLFASPISTFFAADLIITAVVILAYVYQEAARYPMSNR